MRIATDKNNNELCMLVGEHCFRRRVVSSCISHRLIDVMKRRGGKRGLIPQGIIPLPATEAQGDEGKKRNTESNGSGFVIHRKP